MSMVVKNKKNKARDYYKACLIVKAIYLDAKKTYRHNTCDVCFFNNSRMDCYNPCGLYICPFDEEYHQAGVEYDRACFEYALLFKRGVKK